MLQQLKLCSGFGQSHTNEVDPDKPNKRLKSYITVSREDIQALVDNPQSADKTQAQWVIPSTLPSRKFKKQEEQGIYSFLWCDFDKNPPPLPVLEKHAISILDGADFELYNSRSATSENQKARLIVFIEAPLEYKKWTLAQKILNDKFEEEGVTPDRANERSAQLCYLPNRGAFYRSNTKRDGKLFNPMESSGFARAVELETEKLKAEAAALELARMVAMERRTALKLSDAPDLIGAFNLAYSPNEWMLAAGYEQQGNTFRHPHSESGSYSASVREDANGVFRVNALSTNDPLYNQGKGAHDAFSVFCTLFHGGDLNAALKDAGDHHLEIDGLSYNKAMQMQFMREKSANNSLVLLQDCAQKVSFTYQPFPIVPALELTAQPTKIEWVVDNYIERGSLNLLFGESGSYKSLIILDWAFCAAAGIPWHGQVTSQCNVVIIAGEGYSGLGRRIKALEQKYQMKAPEGLFVSKQPASMLDPENVQLVIKSILALCPSPGLIVLDTMHRNMNGDENSSQDIAAFINNIDNYFTPTGAAVLIVHHSGHNQKDRSRGSSSIRAAMDAEFSTVKTNTGIVFSCSKSKDFEPLPPMHFSLKTALLDDWDKVGGEIMTSVYLELDGNAKLSQNGGKPKLSARDAQILASLEEAIDKCGVMPPDDLIKKYPELDCGLQKIAAFNDWRTNAYEVISVDSNEEPKKTAALKKAFDRGRTKLFNSGLTIECGEYVWIA
jgi:hypothetical protein